MPPVVIVIVRLLFVSRLISSLEKNVLPAPVPLSQSASVSPVPNPQLEKVEIMIKLFHSLMFRSEKTDTLSCLISDLWVSSYLFYAA